MRQIALIAELDETRSVGRAAEAIGMSQPAASTLLRGFEEAFEVPLFERHARGIAPTPYGEILTRHARAILAELDQVQDEITSLKSGLSGQASVGAVATPGTNLVPLAVAHLKQQHPGLLVSIDIDYSRPLIDKLLRGHLDVVVARMLDARGAGELQLEPLAGERHVVLAGAGHPFAGRENLRLEDLVSQPWILPPRGSLLRERLTSLFLQRGLPMPRNVVETQSLLATVALLHATDTVVPLTREAVEPLCQSGYLAPLIEDLDLEMGPFGLITRRQHKLSPGAQALITALNRTAGKLYSPMPEPRGDIETLVPNT